MVGHKREADPQRIEPSSWRNSLRTGLARHILLPQEAIQNCMMLCSHLHNHHYHLTLSCLCRRAFNIIQP